MPRYARPHGVAPMVGEVADETRRYPRAVTDSSSDDAAALFVADGDHVVPTEYSRGPWEPGALHGGPVAALVARAAEAVEGGQDLQLVRITLELLRPVPLAPLRVSTTVVRPGRKVQLIDTVVEADGVEVAWSRALRIRTARERGAPPSLGARGRGAAPCRGGDAAAGDPG